VRVAAHPGRLSSRRFRRPNQGSPVEEAGRMQSAQHQAGTVDEIRQDIADVLAGPAEATIANAS
jgi:hypothetical protein